MRKSFFPLTRARRFLTHGVTALLLGLPMAATAQSTLPLGLPDTAILPQTPGVGQSDARSPNTLRNLQLDNEVVRQAYVNNPDLLRFLRATYAEACTRGMLVEASRMIQVNKDGQFHRELVLAATQALEANRIWKLTSVEMEMLFGKVYMHIAYYCDCLMREMTDEELVEPELGLKVIEQAPMSTQASCERLAQERTVRYEKVARELMESGK